MIKLVDRYVGKSALLGLLAVWVILIVLFISFSSLSEMWLIQNNNGLNDVAWFITLTVPRMAYQVLPVSALLGVLVGMGGLASANELVAFRTSGVSRLRLTLAALAGTLLIMTPVMIVGEWVAPIAEQEARSFRLSEMMGQAVIGGPRGVWIRDGSDFVNIQRPVLYGSRGNRSVKFQNVVIYSFADGAVLKAITRADNAIHNGQSWILESVSTVHFNDKGAKISLMNQQPWSTEIKPELMDSAISRPALLSLRSLWKYIKYLGENGLDDRAYQEALWEKIMFPFTVMALVMAGISIVFGTEMSHHLGVRLFFGMFLGGLFIVLDNVIQQIGNLYQIPPFISNSLPPVTLAAASILILRRSV